MQRLDTDVWKSKRRKNSKNGQLCAMRFLQKIQILWMNVSVIADKMTAQPICFVVHPLQKAFLSEMSLSWISALANAYCYQSHNNSIFFRAHKCA